MLRLNFGNREKLVPTQKPTRMFGLKFGMQGLKFNFVRFSITVKLGYNEQLGTSQICSL